jgi:hypothetical protein
MEKERSDSPFLFPGKIKGKPLYDIKKPWAAIVKKANLTDFTTNSLPVLS